MSESIVIVSAARTPIGGMLGDFATVMDDRLRISHSSMRHHVLRILHHGRALCLNVFHRRADHTLYGE